MNSTGTVTLKAKRDKPIRQHHPWIFSGAIQRISSDAVDGEIVDVTDQKGRWLARGLLNRSSQIQVRLLSWEQEEEIDHEFWHRRISRAINLRKTSYAKQFGVASKGSTTNGPSEDSMRLVHAESDFLPGLTVDQYSDYLVIQIGSLGIEKRKHEIAEILLELTNCKGILDRSDSTQRRKERIPPLTDQLLAGQKPDGPVMIEENGLRFQVDLLGGQKTGFYLDQRENRQRVAAYCANKRVLNAFSYTGAFSVYALANGATHVTNLDTSNKALSEGESNLHLNGFTAATQSKHIAGDVFEIFRDWRDLIDEAESGGSESDRDTLDENEANDNAFDVIILDPPKFAQSAGQIDKALRGYKDINMLAMQLAQPDSILATFSCSGLVSADLFQKVLFGAAVDAGRDLQILEYLHQPFDHPTAITFPEGSYLKGFICRVL